eukprot:5737619-Pleurochrysis_carterae.AAC.2
MRGHWCVCLAWAHSRQTLLAARRVEPPHLRPSPKARVTRKCLLHSIHRLMVKASLAGAAQAQRPKVWRSGATWPLLIIPARPRLPRPLAP